MWTIQIPSPFKVPWKSHTDLGCVNNSRDFWDFHLVLPFPIKQEAPVRGWKWRAGVPLMTQKPRPFHPSKKSLAPEGTSFWGPGTTGGSPLIQQRNTHENPSIFIEFQMKRAVQHMRDTIDFQKTSSQQGIRIIYVRIKRDPPVLRVCGVRDYRLHPPLTAISVTSGPRDDTITRGTCVSERDIDFLFSFHQLNVMHICLSCQLLKWTLFQKTSVFVRKQWRQCYPQDPKLPFHFLGILKDFELCSYYLFCNGQCNLELIRIVRVSK